MSYSITNYCLIHVFLHTRKPFKVRFLLCLSLSGLASFNQLLQVNDPTRKLISSLSLLTLVYQVICFSIFVNCYNSILKNSARISTVISVISPFQARYHINCISISHYLLSCGFMCLSIASYSTIVVNPHFHRAVISIGYRDLSTRPQSTLIQIQDPFEGNPPCASNNPNYCHSPGDHHSPDWIPAMFDCLLDWKHERESSFVSSQL